MTQFQSPLDTQMHYGQPLRTSGLAIASIICSLIFFCPVTTIIGPILGVIGLITISEMRGTKGKGLAATAVVLGIFFTVGWIIIGITAGRFIIDAGEFVQTGPRTALTAGFAGDLQGFQNEFHGPGATNPDGAEAFITELRTRYGEFRGSNLMPGSQPRQPRRPDDPAMVAAYVLTFEDSQVNADVELMFADPAASSIVFVYKLSSITVLDSQLGDLKYPPPSGRPTPPDQDDEDDEAAGVIDEGDDD